MRRTALAFIALLLAASPAAADVAPPNSCDTVGETCNTAPPDYRSRGVCRMERCTRTLPGPEGATTMEYDCNLCVAGDGDGNADDGCNVAGGAGVLAMLLVLGGAVAVMGRRRRA